MRYPSLRCASHIALLTPSPDAGRTYLRSHSVCIRALHFFLDPHRPCPRKKPLRLAKAGIFISSAPRPILQRLEPCATLHCVAFHTSLFPAASGSRRELVRQTFGDGLQRQTIFNRLGSLPTVTFIYFLHNPSALGFRILRLGQAKTVVLKDSVAQPACRLRLFPISFSF